jgi:peptide/nickel transport system substrate-binding protein
VPRRLLLPVTLLAVAALLGSACTSSPPPPQGGQGGTLRLAYLADMAQADPDVFYDIEGNTVILSVYEGLLKYKPDSTEVIPSLAEKWEVSSDGLTYTFHLRSGVKFHDGTPFNAQAMKTSFQRRLDVGAAPAYMVQPIASMQTPDTNTFVVRLKHPVAPFLHYMASSWGPKAISPKALADHAGKDHAQTWLNEHADGTGPFQLTAFERGQRYELTRFDGYWGQKAHVDEVEIRIIPDIGTQRLQLQSGDLDGILHSFPQAELESAKSNPDLQVRDFSSFLNNIIYLNTNKKPLSDPALRKTLAGAINRDSLVTEVYGPYAKPSSSTYPSGLLDPALAPVAYPPSETTAAAGAGSKLTFAYTADDSGVHRRLAELVQQRLDTAGFSVTIKEVQLPQVFEYVNDLQAAPDMVMQTNTPDGAHPDMWARIEWYSTGGLNYLGYKSPQADKLLDQALETTDKATADRWDGEAGTIVAPDTAIIFVADPRDVMVLRKNLTGIEHIPNYPWALNLAALQKG